MRLCKLCKKEEAAVRDRNYPTFRMKTICLTCHSKRLLGDLNYCIAVEMDRRKRIEQSATQGKQGTE